MIGNQNPLVKSQMVAHILIKQYVVYQVLAPVLCPERLGHLEEAATSFIKQKEGETV